MPSQFRHVKRLWQLYSHCLDTRPLTTQAITAGVFFIGGDLLSQYMEHRYARKAAEAISGGDDSGEGEEAGGMHQRGKMQWDYVRALRMASYGLFIGPVAHLWYIYLDKKIVFKALTPSSKSHSGGASAAMNRIQWPIMKPVLIKIFLDETIMGSFEIITMFSFVSMLEGKDLSFVENKIRGQFWEVFKVDLALWPAVQAINFLYVPTKYRMLYIGIFNVMWNAFLSFIQNQDVAAEPGGMPLPSKEFDNASYDSTITPAISALAAASEQKEQKMQGQIVENQEQRKEDNKDDKREIKCAS